MDLCRAIGQSFLWSDLLCIVHDDPAGRHAQIQQMDAIYNQATLTILAYSGTHGNEPLPGVQEGTRTPMCWVERLDSDMLLISRPPGIWDFDLNTAYASRGWTFQEDYLSKRRLYISNFQMYFECSVAHFREDERLDAALGRPHHHGHARTAIPNLRTILGYRGLVQFSGYAYLLGLYSERALTYASDRLDAFEGVARVLGRAYGGGFWAGLPSKFLAEALLWRPLVSHAAADRAVGGIPSWSWGSRAVQVHHPFPNDLDLDTLAFPLGREAERIQCIAAFCLSHFTGERDMATSQPGQTKALGRVARVSSADPAVPESSRWMLSSHQCSGLFFFALEFAFPALVRLENAFLASDIDPWQETPLSKNEIERFRTNLLTGTQSSSIDDVDLDAVLGVFGRIPPSGPLRFPERLLSLESLGGNTNHEWPFGQPYNHATLEILLQGSEDFAHDLFEFREEAVKQSSIMSFWTSAASMSHFSFALRATVRTRSP